MKLLFDRFRAGVKPEQEPYLFKILNDVTVLVNEDAIERVAAGEIDLGELPSFVPPYRYCFVECAMPMVKQITDKSGNLRIRVATRIGAFVTYYEQYSNEIRHEESIHRGCKPLEPDEVRWTVSMIFIVEGFRKQVYKFGDAVLFLDYAGKPLAMMHDDEAGYSYTKLDPDMAKELEETFLSENYSPLDLDLTPWLEFMELSLDAVMYTLGMMHCRNIGTEEFRPNASESHKWERKYGVPMNRYHVLKITGKGREAGTLLGTSTGRHNKLHWVRGHFATYDESAPLFGHFVGTVYIHEHIRGDIKRGTVTKDYEVEDKR